MLIEEYGLNIYPVHFYRHAKRSYLELYTVNKLYKFLKNKYPQNIHALKVLTLQIPAPELRDDLLYEASHVVVDKKTDQRRGVPFQPAVYAFYCLHYAQYLEEAEGIKIRTIISGILPRNATWMAYETKTATRIIMLELCASTRDWDWQFASLPLEKRLHKKDLIRWGKRNNFPLEKTRTCGNAGIFQCGVCDSCFDRVESFKKAGINDRTIYTWKKDPSLYINTIITIKHIVRKVRKTLDEI